MLRKTLLTAFKTQPKTTVFLASTSLVALSYFALRSPFPISTATAAALGSSNSKTQARMSSSESFPKGKSESEWQAQLTSEQFRILRKKGTEAAGTGKYDNHQPDKGIYECAGCGTPLYTADTKFKSGCGWPAFFDSIPGAVTTHEDRAWGMTRTEIVCTACGGHLGHLFKGEGFKTPTDERACVNSVSIRYNPDAEAEAAAAAAATKAKA